MNVRALRWIRELCGGALLVFMLGCFLGVPSCALADSSIRILEDFEDESLGIHPVSHFWSFLWGPNGPEGREYSTFDVVLDGSNQVLRMWVSDSIPDATGQWKSPGSSANLRTIHRGPSFAAVLEPAADAVRVKLKIEQGGLGLTFGSAVSQVGNSDVLASVKYVSTNNSADCVSLANGWLQCDFDFNDNLIRNTRRANFSGANNSPIKNSEGKEIIHFTRWIQEPLGLYVVPYDSSGNKVLSGNPVVLFDTIELINKGKGKDFPSFSSPQTVSVVHDFESSIANVFTVDFGFPIVMAPPSLTHVAVANSGTKSLQISSSTAEETAWTAIGAAEGRGANAVTFEMKVSYAATDQTDKHIIDFIALATPLGDSFPWAGLEDSVGYNYRLSEITTVGRNFAIYHARRLVPRNEWVTITIPFADFTAAYGSGSMVEHHTEQLPLTGEQISVVGLQTTYANRRGVTTMLIDNIRYVSVPGTTAALRSYWQGQAFDIVLPTPIATALPTVAPTATIPSEGPVKPPEIVIPTLSIGNKLGRTNQFEWRPGSKAEKRLTVLLPGKIGKKVVRVEIISPDKTTVLAVGKRVGRSGSQTIYRFSKQGSRFPNRCFVVITQKDGSKRHVLIGKTARRMER